MPCTLAPAFNCEQPPSPINGAAFVCANIVAFLPRYFVGLEKATSGVSASSRRFYPEAPNENGRQRSLQAVGVMHPPQSSTDALSASWYVSAIYIHDILAPAPTL